MKAIILCSILLTVIAVLGVTEGKAVAPENDFARAVATKFSRDLAELQKSLVQPRAENTTTTTVAPPTSDEGGSELATLILTLLVDIAYIVYYVLLGNIVSAITSGIDFIQAIVIYLTS